jgi:two-component system nitrate/nitrite response regulator NarL
MNAHVPRILVVGTTRLYCDGIAHLLRHAITGAETATAYAPHDALLALREWTADTVLVEIAMQGGRDLIRCLGRTHRGTPVIALGVDERDDEIISCAEAGAAGFVPRSAAIAELAAVIESAHRGELRCSPRAAASLSRRVAVLAALAIPDHTVDPRGLTDREREVARLVALRLSNKEIASSLGIGCATVKNHVHRILEKLQLGSRAQIASAIRS